ncbi:Beta-galactoside alpha-2,6-sialyltransferase 2 [Homalodisca vitripennis]|nr:Beta-galactoside alpha-2,6-sialyltransferase 2 [Homalodisca vitripennis]
MKAIAVSVWIFINLVFFGMCGYIYLLWSQYWHYISRHQQHSDNLGLVRKSDNRPLVDYFQDTIQLDERIEHLPQDLNWGHQKTTPVIVRRKSKPRFTKVRFTDPPSAAIPCGPQCNSSNKLTAFKNQLIVRLRRVLHEESNVFKSRADNPYSVSYSGRRGVSAGTSPQKLVCDLYRSLPHVRTITGQTKPFAGTELGQAIPSAPLFATNERYNNCAIITNAASFIGSNLGPLIEETEDIDTICIMEEYRNGNSTSLSIQTLLEIDTHFWENQIVCCWKKQNKRKHRAPLNEEKKGDIINKLKENCSNNSPLSTTPNKTGVNISIFGESHAKSHDEGYGHPKNHLDCTEPGELKTVL